MSGDSNMTEMDKLAHLLSHWQEHNDDHMANYLSWAEKAEKAGKTEAAQFLKEAADATAKVSDSFSRAAAALKK